MAKDTLSITDTFYDVAHLLKIVQTARIYLEKIAMNTVSESGAKNIIGDFLKKIFSQEEQEQGDESEKVGTYDNDSVVNRGYEPGESEIATSESSETELKMNEQQKFFLRNDKLRDDDIDQEDHDDDSVVDAEYEPGDSENYTSESTPLLRIKWHWTKEI
ncbi:unnamed protein product [Clavelina lepadiformis]|uniref:Uncharacterized protein n=1 Tax=Clavelina lepadiformis TaxID=159417 RepID=A0ABP0F0J1_CLALP